MNVKETAKVWGIKPYKVLQYIRDGLVPTAELVNAAKEEYEIPDGTPRPPCFRGPAVTMLENIDAIREEGANPYVRGFSYPEVVECYSFFLDCGFIAGFEEPDFQGLDTKGQRKALNAALKCCSITRRGRAFLAGKQEAEKEKPKKRKPAEQDLEGKLSVKVGPAEFGIEYKDRKKYPEQKPEAHSESEE